MSVDTVLSDQLHSVSVADVFLTKPIKATEGAGIISVEIHQPQLGRDAIRHDVTEPGMFE